MTALTQSSRIVGVRPHRATDPPARRRRIVAALLIGIASVGLLALRMRFQPGSADFDQVWFGSRAIWTGRNPYYLVGPGLEFEWHWPLYYPATALLAISPLAPFPLTIARALFVGLSSALLAYGITRESWARMPLFLSGSFIVAVVAAQWSPLLTAAACIPALACIVSAKPNIGLAIVARDPSARVVRYAAVGSLLLTLLSLALLPSWPRDWLALVRVGGFAAPIAHRGGPLLLLALLRWRRPDARLLLAMAMIPHTMAAYATLPLFLIPRTYHESLALTALSSSAALFTMVFVPAPQNAAELYYYGDIIVALCYLPCLIMTLRRPNEGNVPAWLDRVIARIRARFISAELPRR